MDLKKELIFLKPCFKNVVWGGSRLKEEFGYEEAGDSTGECWGISAHPHGDCKIRGGHFDGMFLSVLYREHRELFGNLTEEEFPLLVKILNAKQDLSVQVHPDDVYARAHGGADGMERGKNECWYIMDCPQDASLIIGHHAKTRKELARFIHEGRYTELFREIPVKKGDFIQIASGTIHVIKGGFTILETQQSSDTTYRVYDYGRLVDGKPRALHVQESIDVINVPDGTGPGQVVHTEGLPDDKMHLLIDCSYYKVWKLAVRTGVTVKQEYPFLLVSVLDGKGMVDGQAVCKGDHFLIPYGFGEVIFEGNMEMILSSV